MYKKNILCIIVLAVLLLTIAGCAPQEQKHTEETPQNQLKTDESGKEEFADDEVLVSFGNQTLTMRKIKYMQPRTSPAMLPRAADWWINSLLLFEEAKKRDDIMDNPALKFKAEIENRKIYNSDLVGKIRNAVEVNEEQVKQYYEENNQTDNLLKTPAKYDFFLITSKTLKEAEELIKKINEGTDITSFTTTKPDGTETKKGKMFRNRTTDNISKRHGRMFLSGLSKAKKGDVIGPIQNLQKKYEIARFEAIHQKTKPFNEVKNQIKRKVTNIKQREAVQNLLDSLKEKNADKIHMSPRFLEFTEKIKEENNKKNKTNPN